jgi:hypothetical protein
VPGSEGSSATLETALRAVLDAFDRCGTRYALFGGVAVNLQAAPRTTADIDAIVDVPAIQRPRLLETLEAEGARYGAFDLPHAPSQPRSAADVLREWAADGFTSLWLRGTRIDLLRPVDPIHQAALEHARTLTWENRLIRVSPPEYLVLDKLIAGRPKDIDDIRRLVAAHGERLDRTLIEPWLPHIEQAGGVPEAEARRLLGA